MHMMYNGTARGDQGPPSILRINQARAQHSEHSMACTAKAELCRAAYDKHTTKGALALPASLHTP